MDESLGLDTLAAWTPVLLMPRFGVLAVIGELGIEPSVQGCHEGSIRRGIRQLGASLYVLVGDGDLPRLGRLEFGESGHLSAMDVGWSRKVALEELLSDIPQMLANQLQLSSVRGFSGNDLLHAAFGRTGDDVGGRG